MTSRAMQEYSSRDATARCSDHRNNQNIFCRLQQIYCEALRVPTTYPVVFVVVVFRQTRTRVAN